MIVPKSDYTLESFLEYLVNNLMKVFENQPKWLKVHLVFAKHNWKEIFESIPTEDFGEIVHIIFENKNDEKTIDFYAYEWTKGLLMMITSSTEEDYEKSLKQFIIANKGITESWIKPSIFEEVKNHLLSTHDARIYRFISKRNREDYWPITRDGKNYR